MWDVLLVLAYLSQLKYPTSTQFLCWSLILLVCVSTMNRQLQLPCISLYTSVDKLKLGCDGIDTSSLLEYCSLT